MSSPDRERPKQLLSSSPSPDTPSQFPFPRRKSSQIISIPDKSHARAQSVAGSVGGILDTGRGASSPTSYGQNAISTLLQPPIVRSGLAPHVNVAASGFKAPTTRDIPPVTLTNIPHVDSKSFQPYLSQVGSLYEAFRRAKEEVEGDNQLFRRERKGSKDAGRDGAIPPRLARPTPSRTSSVGSLTSPTEESQSRRGSYASKASQSIPSLSTIPPVFFEPDFHLENPRTFDVVSERSEIIRDRNPPPDRPNSGRKALATNAILQEKLSWYMDTVEIHLISSISTASKSFFSALGSLRELHGEVSDSIARIQTLRGNLKKLDEEMAVGGLKVVDLKQRRQNVRQLAQAVSQLQGVVRAVSDCEDLVEAGQVETALDQLDDVERLIAGQQSSRAKDLREMRDLRDLRGIRALDGAFDDLSQLRQRIGKVYETQFLASLLEDLRKHVGSVPHQATLRRWATSFNRTRVKDRQSHTPKYMSVETNFRSELQGELEGLARSRHTTPAAAAFKASILREMKAIIRRNLPSSNDDDNESMMSASTQGGRQRSSQEKSTILARNLRDLDPEDAHMMLTRIYTSVSESLRRLSIQVKILLDVTSSLSRPPGSAPRSTVGSPNPESRDGFLSPRSPSKGTPLITLQEDMQQALDMSSLLGEAVDIIQAQITKVVKVRSEQTAHLPLAPFLRFFTLNRLFADECEAISGRGGQALKNTVDSQIKEFVALFSNQHRHHVIEVLDADKWEARDFGEAQSSLLARVIEGGTQDAPVWTQTTMIWLGDEEREAGTMNGVLSNGNTGSKDKIRSAVIDEQRFILPESAATILQTVESFQCLMTGLPSMGQEIANGLLECLKLFNSRSSQLILGAGATRSAGLKNITTKHLALASQALSFIVALTPYIREFFRRYMSSTASNLMPEFDKVKRLYQDHQNAINEKFIDIMGSRSSIHASAMKKIDWDGAAEKKNPSVSPYIEALTKETGTLHKVLSKHLPAETVASIMKPVFASYKEQWSTSYRDVVLRSAAGKER